MRLLINLRRDKNEDYWRRFGKSKVLFWNEIAAKIQEDLGTAFTGVIHETEIKPPGSKWSGPGPPEGRNRVEIGSK